MLSRLFLLTLTAWVPFSFAETSVVIAAANQRFAQYEKACADIARNVPSKLANARKLAPLVEEIVRPDMDYCHEDMSQCDLRTLVFKDFTLRLLHYKPTDVVYFHVGEFRNTRALEKFCGPDCKAVAEHDEEAGMYVMDCQQNI